MLLILTCKHHTVEERRGRLRRRFCRLGKGPFPVLQTQKYSHLTRKRHNKQLQRWCLFAVLRTRRESFPGAGCTCSIVPSFSLSHTPASIPSSTSCASIFVAEACLVTVEKHSNELTSCRLQEFSVCLLARLSSSRSVRYCKQEAEMQSLSLLHKCAEMTFVKLLTGR